MVMQAQLEIQIYTILELHAIIFCKAVAPPEENIGWRKWRYI